MPKKGDIVRIKICANELSDADLSAIRLGGYLWVCDEDPEDVYFYEDDGYLMDYHSFANPSIKAAWYDREIEEMPDA